MEIIATVLILLTLSLFFGEVLKRVGVPAVTGEILTGITLGPAIIGLIKPDQFLSGFSEIALFFIILLLGIDEDFNSLIKNFFLGSKLSLGGFLIPMAAMLFLSVWLLRINIDSSLFLVLSISIPSISITSALIRNSRLAGTSTGSLIVSAVVISDVIGFIVVSILLNPESSYVKVGGIVTVIIALLLIDLAMRNRKETVNAFFERIHAKRGGSKIIFGSVIVFALLISFILEMIGISYILGAFFAGILVSDVNLGEQLRDKVKKTLSGIESSFFGPLFFSIAGLDVVIPNMHGFLTLTVMLPVTAIIGSLLIFLIIRKHQPRLRRNHVVGIFGSRGAVGIVIASIGFANGFLTPELYSVAMLSTVILSIVMPISFVRETHETLQYDFNIRV